MLGITLKWTSITSMEEQRQSQLVHDTETRISSSLIYVGWLVCRLLHLYLQRTLFHRTTVSKFYQCCLRVATCILNLLFVIPRTKPKPYQFTQYQSQQQLLHLYKLSASEHLITVASSLHVSSSLNCKNYMHMQAYNILAMFQFMTLPPVVTCSVGVQFCTQMIFKFIITMTTNILCSDHQITTLVKETFNDVS